MAGIHLEVFRFGMYILFPIGIMYYFGTNLDGRFDVPGFWPKAQHGHKIPYEKEDIQAEIERLRARKLYRKRMMSEEAKPEGSQE